MTSFEAKSEIIYPATTLIVPAIGTAMIIPTPPNMAPKKKIEKIIKQLEYKRDVSKEYYIGDKTYTQNKSISTIEISISWVPCC